MNCSKCGVEMHVGDFPFCPHGAGIMRVNSDECDYVDHNLGKDPIRITSWSQRRALMAAQGLQDYAYDVPVPDDAAPMKGRPTQWRQYRQCDAEHMEWLGKKLSMGKAEKTDDDSRVNVTVTTGTGIPEGYGL